MHPAWVVGLALLALLVVVLALRQFIQGLRARGRDAIAKRYAPSEVLFEETLAQSFGEQSRGVTQMRGNGALALTKGELFFLLYVPTRELRIPLASIATTSIVRSHLGKTQGAKLLHVRYTADGAEDAIAWRVPDAEAWKAKIDAARG